jgi:hypothetical protein
MSRAILLTGFNNWGKTHHIYSLFNRGRFYLGAPYAIPGVNINFTVESHSNDDYNETNFINTLTEKLDRAPPDAKNLFCAFCPSREPNNNSKRILQTNPFTEFDEIHLLLLKQKWDLHAELKVIEIKQHFSGLTNIHYTVVDADASHVTDIQRQSAREAQIVAYLAKLYP